MISFLAKENLHPNWQERGSRIFELPIHDELEVRGSQRVLTLAYSALVYSIILYLKLAGALFKPVLDACRVNGPTFWRLLLHRPLLVDKRIEPPMKSISGY